MKVNSVFIYPTNVTLSFLHLKTICKIPREMWLKTALLVDVNEVFRDIAGL